MLPSNEKALLQILNKECVLSDEHWTVFWDLTDKQEKGQISITEQQEFEKLIQEEEQLRLKRINILGKIAQIRDVSLENVALDLGLIQH